MDISDYYSILQLAKRWHCSRGVLIKKIHQGELKAIRPPWARMFLVSKDEVERIDLLIVGS